MQRFGIGRNWAAGAAILFGLTAAGASSARQESARAPAGQQADAQSPSSSAKPAPPAAANKDAVAPRSAPGSASSKKPNTDAQALAVANFGWLAGDWQGQWGERIAEQQWMAPRAGMMVGTLRLIENGKPLVIELFTLIDRPEGVELRLRHFTAELVPWESGGAAALLKLASSNRNKIVFENPAAGQPKRAIFTRLDEDHFTIRFDLGAPSASPQAVEISYRRLASPAIAHGIAHLFSHGSGRHASPASQQAQTH